MIWTGVTDAWPQYVMIVMIYHPEGLHAHTIYQAARSVEARTPFSCLLTAISTFSFLLNKTQCFHRAVLFGVQRNSWKRSDTAVRFSTCMHTHAPTHTVRAYFVFTFLRSYEFDMSITFCGFLGAVKLFLSSTRVWNTLWVRVWQGRWMDGWGKLLPGALPAPLRVFNCLLLFL